jgi:hypothetical protein
MNCICFTESHNISTVGLFLKSAYVMFPTGAQIWHIDYYFADWLPIYTLPLYKIGGKKPRKLILILIKEGEDSFL